MLSHSVRQERARFISLSEDRHEGSKLLLGCQGMSLEGILQGNSCSEDGIAAPALLGDGGLQKLRPCVVACDAESRCQLIESPGFPIEDLLGKSLPPLGMGDIEPPRIGMICVSPRLLILRLPKLDKKRQSKLVVMHPLQT